ncbi:hypothetical protein [uncultured Pseudonocardia sp.]|jgi:hypothetical protein|uniref:hypothetical protein n=2 Tax=Pseudonocardia TaxID=1847 RepID=UPI002607AC64|nr:hypothetical protein [uncultured Pseudonocardia sp.]
MTHSLTTPAAAAPRRRRVVRTVLALAVAGAVVATVVVLVSGAGASSDPADAPAVLVTQADFQPGATPPCLMHQTEQPNSAYEGGPDSQPPQQLTFLAYYTAAGKEPFCDGGTATDTDKAWAQLYVQLTTSADNVSTVLG